MAEIGIRELKTHASEILKSVRDAGARYTVTYRGRPIGVLLPLPPTPRNAPESIDAWEEFARLREQVSRRWQSPLSSVELLSEMRR